MSFNVTAPENAAPGHCTLNRDDLQYLIDRVIHTRYTVSEDYKSGVSTDYSRMFEAAKTIAQAAIYLCDAFHFWSANLELEPTKLIVNGELSIVGVDDLMITKDEEAWLKFRYTGKHSSKTPQQGTYEVWLSTRMHPKLYHRVYTLNDHAVMSYDMNFPAPISFITEIRGAFLDKMSESKTNVNDR